MIQFSSRATELLFSLNEGAMEKPLKKILFATDLTPEAKQVFEYVKKIVAATGASVAVVHIIEKVDMGTDEMLSHFLGEKKWRQFRKDKFEKAESLLIGKIRENKLIREAIECFLENINCEEDRQIEDKIIVEEGAPAEKIVELAKINNCELIVMGREKRSVLGMKYLGGTLKDIIRRSEIPVLTVPYDSENR
jgi:nucleotide-binding universal stress UspA family protein